MMLHVHETESISLGQMTPIIAIEYSDDSEKIEKRNRP